MESLEIAEATVERIKGIVLELRGNLAKMVEQHPDNPAAEAMKKEIATIDAKLTELETP